MHKLLVDILLSLGYLTSLILFLYGFFPAHKSFLQGSHYSSNSSRQLPSLFEDVNQITDCELNYSRRRANQNDDFALFDRVVLLLIDALRSDFILSNNGSHMTFVRQTIDQSSQAVAYVAVAQAPTVTMPRVRALLAGIPPAFIDVVLNLASPAMQDDNLIAKAVEVGRRRIAFYGDDTWLKLFAPADRYFVRHQGLLSFFVTDYIEIDNNITENLLKELNNEHDWDWMILHYLGLDHLGHLSGPKDSRIAAKLSEMDRIAKLIYEQSWFGNNSLLIIVGDHGMSESGSHGGSSYLETRVPLVFMSPAFDDKPLTGNLPSKIYYQEVEQIDLVPTLASLVGLPIPRNSLGVVLIEVLQLLSATKRFSPFQRLMMLHDNARQLLLLLNAYDSVATPLLSVTERHRKLISRICTDKESILFSDNDNIEIAELESEYLKAMHAYRDHLIAVFVDYNFTSILIGLFLAVLLNICMLSTIVDKSMISNRFYAIFALNCLSLTSSSFIEEQHTVVYFLHSTTVLLYFILPWNKFEDTPQWRYLEAMLALICHRLLCSWHTGGQKWAHLTDVADWFNQSSFLVAFLLLAVCTTTCFLLFSNLQWTAWRLTSDIGFNFLVLCCQIFKLLNMANAVNLVAQIVYSICILRVLVSRFADWRLVSMTLGFVLIRPGNLPVLCLIIFQTKLLTKLIHSTSSNNISQSSLIVFWHLFACAFFYIDNSNSLANVDLASGYLGLPVYCAPITALLILLHLYSGPLMVLCSVEEQGGIINLPLVLKTVFVYKCSQTTFYLFVMLLMCNHLFIWSVFAPKLLYECLHCAALFFVYIFSHFVYQY